MPAKTSISQEEKMWGAASYLWIISVVALASKKNNDFIRFHANQGALLFAISIPMFVIPMVGWFINFILGVIAIIGILKALGGEKWQLPVLADTAKQFGDWLIKTLKL